LQVKTLNDLHHLSPLHGHGYPMVSLLFSYF
jgi:hypothetical protein